MVPASAKIPVIVRRCQAEKTYGDVETDIHFAVPTNNHSFQKISGRKILLRRRKARLLYRETFISICARHSSRVRKAFLEQFRCHTIYLVSRFGFFFVGLKYILNVLHYLLFFVVIIKHVSSVFEHLHIERLWLVSKNLPHTSPFLDLLDMRLLLRQVVIERLQIVLHSISIREDRATGLRLLSHSIGFSFT